MSSQDKQLPATERRLQKARKDGQAARSRDLSHLVILGMGSALVWAAAPLVFDYLRLAMRYQLVFDANVVQWAPMMLERLQTMVGVGLMISLGFALITNLAVALGTIGGGGWIYSLKPLEPQFNRLNPLKGLGNLFSKQQIVTVSKTVLMILILGYVAWRHLAGNIDAMAALVLQPSHLALAQGLEWLVKGVSTLLLVVFLLAVVDVPLQAFLYKSRMKMSHEEVKQEHKESDGNPQLKGRMRQRAREIANRASVSHVPDADFVVMNPTHYAVALRYDEASMAAPQVISKGSDLLAFKIKEIAQQHQVPVLQSPMLARALYAHAELDQPIPAPLFAAVAQVLAYVYRLKAALRGEGRMPEEQPDPQVPPELDPHSPQAQSPQAKGR